MDPGLRRDGHHLFAEAPKLFDLSVRRWVETPESHGKPVALRDAVCWLQRTSGAPCGTPIAVIGPRDASDAERQAAFVLGAGLGDLGLTLICGGKSGIMEAACAGAASVGGLSIGILPEGEWEGANPFVTVPIATGIGEARPIMGLFGNEDGNPTRAHVDRTEAELKRLGKTYEFYRYDGAGHAFFAHYRPNYRVEPAVDGWNKVFAFYAKTLSK